MVDKKISHITPAILERCRKLAIRKGFRDLSQDFVQEMAAGKLGPRQKIEHAFIDFLRKTFGSASRSPKIYAVKKAERTAIRDFEKVGLAYADLPSEIHFDDILRIIPNKIDKAIIALYFVWGFTCREIGLCFGLTESKVGIRLKNMKKYLKEKYY